MLGYWVSAMSNNMLILTNKHEDLIVFLLSKLVYRITICKKVNNLYELA
ncbi:hypothetical protein A1OE_144 [Candidatus Endolissoclinum faulkneri L2]|uniref:Uncharacterized protein n=1 Tax=Candidatus Endolissoclinum faulkneri L2 TaxID=1193729 RepID=K7Z305_9PROT|nr:hypothetical protein A1OE_144 [Candidatus Endolissoclinum faulkneri L2]